MVNGYFCNCATGRTGKKCEFSSNPPCFSSPCSTKGTSRCIDIGQYEYKCECLPGFKGTVCNSDDNECISLGVGNACYNNGECINTIGSYRCECAKGFEGDSCEKDLNECAASPCAKGATCIEILDGGFECQCPPEQTGVLCDITIEVDSMLAIILGVILVSILVIFSLTGGVMLKRNHEIAEQKKKSSRNKQKKKMMNNGTDTREGRNQKGVKRRKKYHVNNKK